MNKPIKPNITIPESFAANGVKADFDNNKILNGFDRTQPDVLAGDNLNKFIDDTYKGLNYGIAAADAINLIQEDEVLTVKNGELVSGKQAGCWIPSLFQTFWSNYKLNRMDMLRADTFSWQSGEAYSNAYNKLVEEYDNESSTTETSGVITYKLTPNGFKIADATQEQAILNLYNSTGSAKIYILDKENTRFKLPRWKHKTIKDSETIPVKGNGLCLGITNGSGTAGFYHYKSNTAYVNVENTRYGTPVGGSVSNNSGTLYGGLGITSDSSKSGIVAEVNNVETDDMYLYFYVGEYTQSAIEQTAGLNAELLNQKLDLNVSNLDVAGKSLISGLGMPSNRYIDLTLGASGSTYTAPANGFYTLGKTPTAQNQYIAMGNVNKKIISTIWSTSAQALRIFVPVLKNDIITIEYTAGGTTEHFRFVYAEGENN